MNLSQNLQTDLRSFGLNPEEWVIFREKISKYSIVNKFDRDFQLEGTTKSLTNLAQIEIEKWENIRLKQL